MQSPQQQRKWIHRADRLAAFVVRFAGIAVILSVFAILFFISLEAYPLIRRATSHTASQESLAPGESLPVDLGLDEQGEVAYLVRPHGAIDFISLEDGQRLESQSVMSSSNASITAASHTATSPLVAMGNAGGEIALVKVEFRARFEDGHRTITYRTSKEGRWQLAEAGESVAQIVGRENEDGQYTVAVVTEQGRLLFLWTDPYEEEEERADLTSEMDAPPTVAALTTSGEDLLVGTEHGWVYHWDVSEPEEPELVQRFQATSSVRVAVTALAFLIGDESLVVGDATGGLGIYFRVRVAGEAGKPKFQRIREFDTQGQAVTHIAVSPRGKGFLAGDATGAVTLRFSTSHRTLLHYNEHETPIRAMAFAPKANGALSLDTQSMLRHWKIESPHPEASLSTLFGKVWYENYPKADFVWQTTGATETESKFSLVPLMFGTLKATLYAMLFSVPVSLMGALYTSQFAPKRLRSVVKPTVELMASIPSVVIGFLAGLWLSPLLERMLVTSFLLLVIAPIGLAVGVLLWQLVPETRRTKLPPGTEIALVVALLCVSTVLTALLATPIEASIFEGDLRQWLFQKWDVNYDNRNALVVGFALGFAVIPIIYTIAEDALSNVPPSLTSAALALGASRTQAAMRIVLPAASPGIFAAIMLGLGRAVGETMIVLMASGNAPLIDWSAFNGMRTMSAAIAIEIPEAPRGDTLYRVLFLVAALLFLFTFVINALSNLVSTYLRKKYSRF